MYNDVVKNTINAYSDRKEYSKEYRKINAEKIKKYREENKDKIKIKKDEYRKINKEKIKIKKDEYRKINKEKINDLKKQIIICQICNKSSTNSHFSRHCKSNSHKINLCNKYINFF